MKSKFLNIFIFIFIVFSLVGCAGEKGLQGPQEEQETQSENQTKEDEYQISIEEMSEIYDLENLLLKSNCKISIYMEDELIIENDFDNGTIHSYSPNYDEFTVKIKKSDDDKGYLLQFLQPGKDFDKYNGKVFTVLEDIGDIIFPDGFIVVFLIDYNLLEYDEKEQLYVARNIEMTFKDYSSLMLQEYKLKVKNGIIQSINFVGYDTNYSLQFSDYNNVDLEN